MRLAVASILSSKDWGCLWSGLAEDGERVRVNSKESIWPTEGEVYEVAGEPASFRDRWGKTYLQINGARLTRVRSSGRLLVPWLKGLPGLGETRAPRLLEAFGPDLLDVLDDPARIPEIAGAIEPARPALAVKLATAVQAAYAKRSAEERDGVSEARFYARLEEAGIEDRAAARGLWRLLGADAWGRLGQRPYTMSAVLPWSKADHLGQRLLSDALGTRDVRRHPDRLAGAVDSAVRDMLRRGDTGATRLDFLRGLANKDVPAEAALRVGLERRRVLAFRGFLLAPGAAYLERDVHRHLDRLRGATPPFDIGEDSRIRAAVATAERETGLALTAEQRTAVAVLLQQRVALLQGGAGTGKTWSMRVLVAAWELLGGRVEAAALAGKAALRLAHSTGMDVLTIARMLKRLEERAALEASGKIGPEDEGELDARGWAKKRLPRFTSRTLLLIDEASMVDLASIRRLLHRLPDGAALLLVGDVAQLQPVGIGQVFHDLVGAGRGVVELTRTLRQAADNPLLAVAAAIRAGRAPAVPPFGGAAVGVQIEECAPKDIEARLRAVRSRLAEEAPTDESLVIAGRNGTVQAICRAEMFRRQGEGAIGAQLGPLCPWVAEGDPVIMGVNHYRFGLANGQLGRVTSLHPVEILWEGAAKPWAVGEEYRHDILSAWAITCHRAQGSEAARVAVALDSRAMLTRQWFYTAITRAKTQAVLVGPRDLIDAAVRRLASRTTGFSLLGPGTSV